MGMLVPEDFDLASLANDAERRVVEAFRDRLSDGWLVLPDVALATDHRDHQLDVVLVHEQFGVADIEVKGHRVGIVEGQWRCGSRVLAPQPPAQAKGNAYALRDELRRALPDLERLEVPCAVALPNTASISGSLPPGFDRRQILIEEDVTDPVDAVERLMAMRANNQPLTAEDVGRIVGHLRPDASFSYDPTSRMRQVRNRLDEMCAVQTQTLERLDVNRRVVAMGAAGTGKTRLAMRWAQRALTRDERVLITCYNEPLARVMSDGLVDDDHLTVGPFLRLALAFDGMPRLAVPEGADHDWWTITAVGHLHTHWPKVVERFDTIVVDEAQDFSPAWLALLEGLLDPDGPRRMLLLADPSQELYPRGFRMPEPDDGWALCELVSNCRNARQIGTLLRRKLGGAPAPAVGPEAIDVRFVSAHCGAVGCGGDRAVEGGGDQAGRVDHDRLASRVQVELDRLVLTERDPAQIMVLTFSSQVRDHLARLNGLGRWEDRDDRIPCENVHRMKGLEADTVILVADRPDVADDLLYVGVSRAVSELIVVGPGGLAERLGLAAP